MANITTTLSAEDTLINTLITKLRNGEYDSTLTKVERETGGFNGYRLNDNVTIETYHKGNSVRSFCTKKLVIG